MLKYIFHYKQTMQILQYNCFLRNEIRLFGLFQDAQEPRAKAISDLLIKTHHEVDILVLNEVFHSSGKEMLSVLADNWPYQSEMLSSFFVPVSSGIYVLSKTEIDKEDGIVFSDGMHLDYFVSKGVRYVSINKIHIFATHLQATYTKKATQAEKENRTKQLIEIKSFIKKQNISSKEFVFVVGDLNINYKSSEYVKMVKILNVVPIKYHSNHKYSYDNKNQLSGMVTELNDECRERYKHEHKCQCCASESIDYVLSVKRYRKPRNMVVDILDTFKPNSNSIICGNVGKKLYKKPTDQCSRSNELQLTDLSDHYPVLCKFEIKSPNY
jgi:endonuclease/exonuclease/phosphatase family metal-dependent hydrolase